MTITEFLLARIAEDEAAARETVNELGGWAESSADLDAGALLWHARRVLAECEAKRRIVALHLGTHECVGAGPGGWDGVADEDTPCPTLTALAAVYADHPDCDPNWRP